MVYQVDEERGDDVHKLEALQKMMLIWSHEGKVADDQHYHTDVLYQLKLRSFLVQDSH